MVKAALALLLCGAFATATAVTEQSARRLPAAYVKDGSFENEETGGWNVKCKSAFSRVESGSGSGGPEQPKSGSHMLHFDGSRCPGKGGMSFTLRGLPEMVPMHVSMYIWLPEGDCTNDEMASKCPQLSYSKGNTNAGVGTMVTAIANQWNLISGTVFSDGGDVELILGNMPADSDLWFDDFAVANCGMEAFRAHSDAKIDEVRRRTTRVNVGKSGAETAKITMLKHEFPFGGAMWDDCVDSDNCKAFVKEHFNTIVAETGMKWWDEEPEDGDNTGTGEKYKAVAKDLGVELRAHSTYWEDNYKVQDWVKNLPRDGSRDSLQYAIWRRMQQYVERYGDQVSAFDVNNEMLHGTFYKDALPCGGDGPCMCDLEDACPDGMGVDRDADVHTWMYKAMKYLLPDSRRFINDYCQMHYCSKHFALAKLVKEARDIPDVTDMGVQGHLTNSMTVCGLDLMARFDHAVAAINGGTTDGSASLRDIYDAPRKMWVTEMDVQDKDLSKRADGYETFYRAAYASPGVAGVMTWGWREGHEWRPDIAMVGEDYRLTLEPGQRVFQGLLKGAWDASQDSTAVYPPDGEGDAAHVYFGAFPGTYTISAGGCTGSFTVPVGLGDYEVDAGNWEC